MTTTDPQDAIVPEPSKEELSKLKCAHCEKVIEGFDPENYKDELIFCSLECDIAESGDWESDHE